MNNYVNMMKLAAYIEGWPVAMQRINEHSPFAHEGLCISGHARVLWGDRTPIRDLLGLEEHEKYTTLITPNGWLYPPPEQKERVLALLRGQIKLTPDWLHNPEWIESAPLLPPPLPEEVPCMTS